ncbi:MAG TPA: alanine--tRNA ligase-related protein, partial [Anaerolineales bacterium]|nr:alanine--tRNA ligase-related protein [Anaerolineales bacterium]
FNRDEKGNLTPLPQQNVDTGMGLERTVMILNGLPSIYEIDTFVPLMKLITEQAGKRSEKHERILADHIKAATFVLGDEHPIEPSNTKQGYVLRRIIRRAMMAARELRMSQSIEQFMSAGAELIVNEYGAIYPSLPKHKAHIIEQLAVEAEKFNSGLKKIDQILQNRRDINGQQAFELYSTYGFPLEIQVAEAGKRGIHIDTAGFEEAMKEHQEKSRTAAAGLFKGGLADHSEMSVKYHTATHLLHQALRDVLGTHVFQKGSNITPERLRFDFSHPDKMTPEQIQKTEDLVNKKIQADLSVKREEMSVPEAKAKGALGLFEGKYADRVSVYSMGDYSREICGGPHVEHTGVLGKFKILKEESAGSGIRRVKAVLQ